MIISISILMMRCTHDRITVIMITRIIFYRTSDISICSSTGSGPRIQRHVVEIMFSTSWRGLRSMGFRKRKQIRIIRFCRMRQNISAWRGRARIVIILSIFVGAIGTTRGATASIIIQSSIRISSCW